METLKSILVEAKIPLDNRLHLFTKNEGGGTQTTGPHKVKLIDSKIIKGSDFMTGKEKPRVRLSLEENGEPKQYDFDLKDSNGDVHYLVQRLAAIPEGSEIILEGKSQGGRSFTDVQSVNGDSASTTKDDIPVIDEDEVPPAKKTTEEKTETEETNEEEIDVSKIDFK